MANANGKLNFGSTYTVEQFKKELGLEKISIRRNPSTNHLFFSYLAEGQQLTGAVGNDNIPKKPMISMVCPEGETLDPEHCGQKGYSTFFMVHEEGTGAPVIQEL